VKPPLEMTEAADRAGEAAFAEVLEHGARRLPILYQRFDEFCEEALRGVEVACKAGCSNCCSQWVPGVKPFEIERIAKHAKDSGAVEEIIAALRDRVDAHDRISSDDRDLAYARLGLPCVFLTSDGTCGIRPIRPLTCRSFFSFGPPERCAGHAESTGFMLEPHRAYDDVLARATEDRLDDGSPLTGELIRDLLRRLACEEP
jgi:Fe-S-cluster containining protein